MFQLGVPIAAVGETGALGGVVDADADLVLALALYIAGVVFRFVVRESALGFWALLRVRVGGARSQLWAGATVARFAHPFRGVKLARARVVAFERVAERVARNSLAFGPANTVCPRASRRSWAVTCHRYP